LKMKQMKLLILIFLLAFFPLGGVHAQILKMVKVGKAEARIYDHGCQSHEVYDHSMVTYYRGSYISVADAYENTWPGGLLKSGGMLFGARNWVDTTGHVWDVMITGHNTRLRELDLYQFAVPDENGFSIRRYMRYPLPQVIVDGVHTEDPFPTFGDEVAPGEIWGTADIMVESDVRLSMGLDVKQRVLAWSQPGHDDYIIWDWTFVNTGNVDMDDEIELPGQTLEDVYIARVNEAFPNGSGDNKSMGTFAGTTEDGDNRLSYPQDDDSLRIDYMTPLRAGSSGSRDSYGFNVSLNQWNVLTGARFGGSAVLFAPKSCDVPQAHPITNVAASNDPAQPSMHTSMLAEPSWITLHNDILSDFPAMTPQEFVDAYEVMVKGVFGIDTTIPNFQETYYMDSLYDVYDTTASGAPTYYEQPLDRWGELDPDRGYAYVSDISWARFDMQTHWSIGPYQMEFGDTLRYVYAYIGGAINRKSSYLAGEAWDNGEAASYSWLAELDSAQMVDELRQRDPIFNVYYTNPVLQPAPTVNDIAKDLLVATGKDSLFNNGMNAQRNFNMGYDIPASPNPPSIFEVTSGPDMIRLTWSYAAGYEPSSSDLAGFKIYRALGGYVYEKQGEIITGDWQLIDSVNGGLREYADTSVTPAVEYYYAITAVSPAGIESGMYLTMTKKEATLQSYPGDSLEMVRVVPNPLNVNASARTRYPADELKITFVELPPMCTITILTESGNLVRTIEHTSGSGTEIWKVSNQFLLTDSDQQPASGIYIAHIRDNRTGETVSRKFLIVR
jgi:hypothetical protein